MKNKNILVSNINIFIFFLSFFVKKIYIINKGRYSNLILKIIEKMKLTNFCFNFFNIEFIKDGKEIKSYPSLEAISREQISHMAFKYNSDILNPLNTLVGEKASKSFYTKGICYYSGLASYYKAYLILTEKCDIKKNNILCLFESEISKIMELEVLFESKMINNIIDKYFKFKLLITINKMFYLKKDNSFSNKKKFEYASEINHSNYFEKKFAEPNYLTFSKKCLYYLTSQQNMEKINYSKFEKLDSFVDVRNKCISLVTKNDFTNLISKTNKLDKEKYLLLLKLFNTYSEYEYLFSNFDISHNIFLQFTNDKRFVRLDSAIVTYLANKYNTNNISYQTRTPYLNDYTFYYDYFNVFFSWSPFWYSSSELTNSFEEIIPLGIDNSYSSEQKSNQVLIFTSDIADVTHNTKSYNINIINIAKELALKYKDFQFIIKTKFEEQSRKEFKDIELLSNMKYAHGTYELNKLISNSFIVISMGFTSPGFQAIIQGVNTIYYSELNFIQNKVSEFEFVANSYDEVESLFEKYVNNQINILKYKNVFNKQQNESFRDAILNHLKSLGN